MEMLIVVAIIGVSLAAAAPTIQAALANRRSQEAALDVVRLARRARSEAIAFGRAHLLRYDEDLGGGNGALLVYRGITSGCNTNDWATITSGPACGENDSMCIDGIDMTDYAGGTTTTALTVSGMTEVDICYTSSGVMMWRSETTARFSENNIPSRNGFQFTFVRRENGEDVGVSREIIFPFGGTARVKR